MPIDPISWVLIGLLVFDAGVIVAAFWDEIKAWASRMLGYILDAINWAVEVTSKAAVYLVKQGTRIYKRVEVYVRNIYSRRTRLDYRQEETSPYDVPDDINEELDRKMKIKLMEQST